MGRPKGDHTGIVDAALLRWQALDGGRDRRVLDLAILDTARDPPSGFIREFNTLRKLIRRELCKLDDRALRLALSVAHQRAMLHLWDAPTNHAPVPGLLGTIAPATQSPNDKALTAGTAARAAARIPPKIEDWRAPYPSRPTYGLWSLSGALPFPLHQPPTSPYEFWLLADGFRRRTLELLLLTDRLSPLYALR
jgi:hypothetical protein